MKQIERPVKLLLALSGEAYNDIGAQSNARNSAANTGDESLIVLYSIASSHRMQDIIIRRLKGQAQVLADLIKAGHRFDKSLAHILRVGGQEAYPSQTIDPA